MRIKEDAEKFLASSFLEFYYKQYSIDNFLLVRT